MEYDEVKLREDGRMDDRNKKMISNMKAGTRYLPVTYIAGMMDERNPNLIKRSGCERLLDLGSAGDASRKVEYQKTLEEIGINEYFGVDLAFEEDSDYKTRESMRGEDSVKPKDRIKIRTMRKEILETLCSMPDNYANVHMTGLDSSVFGLSSEWGDSVLAELRRVVPKNGFVYTDCGFMDDVLSKNSEKFKGLHSAYRSLNSFFGDKSGDEDNKKIVEGYRCGEDDEFRDDHEFPEPAKLWEGFVSGTLGKYVVDMPELELRAYTDEMRAMSNQIILINTKD